MQIRKNYYAVASYIGFVVFIYVVLDYLKESETLHNELGDYTVLGIPWIIWEYIIPILIFIFCLGTAYYFFRKTRGKK
jgi:hypothetical protein